MNRVRKVGRWLMAPFLLAALVAGPAWADLTGELSRLVGFTIIHAGTVTGYVDRGGKVETDFEGCDFGRKLIIDETYSVTCASYGYHYAYRPDVVVLTKGSVGKAIIDGEVFDISLR